VKWVQASGVGTNEGDWDTKKIGAIAMPIFHHNRALGCLNIVYFTRTLAVNEALKKLGVTLWAAVGKTGSRLDAQNMAGA
jgi:IclR family mhp operon transcriptional activator